MSRIFAALTLFLALCLFTVAPALTAAALTKSEIDANTAYQRAYVPCGYTATDAKNSIYKPCGFSDVLELGRRIITGWIMAGVIISVLGFTYAGYLYITAMGSEEKIKHAHSIFYKIVLGFVFMLSAWLIAKVLEDTFLTGTFTNPTSGSSFLR